MPTSINHLPAALLAQILQHVPLQQRLRDCAVVCTAWAAAAALATSRIRTGFCHSKTASWNHQKQASLEAWLCKHGRGVQQLSVSHYHYDGKLRHLQLPVAELEQLPSLHLYDYLPVLVPDTSIAAPTSSCCAMRNTCSTSTPDSSDGSSMVLAQGMLLPKLRELGVCCTPPVCSCALLQLAQLAAVSGLTKLRLSLDLSKPPCDESAASVDHSASAPAASAETKTVCSLELALQQLSQLQHLDLRWPYLTASSLKGVSSTLTALSLSPVMSDEPSLPPTLPQLVHMRRLSLLWAPFYPTVLKSMLQLQHLRLQGCELLGSDDDGGGGGVADLLAAVGQMTLLEQMVICGIDLSLQTPQHFSALTASSHLLSQVITAEEDQPLPPGAAKHMFPAGQVMPALQELHLGCWDADLCADVVWS